MKKIYFSIFTVAMALTSNAQLILTQAFNEPVAGNIKTTKQVDTLSVIVPKSTGINQMWDFSAMMATGTTETTTYGSASAGGPNASAFPGTTLTDFDGGSFYDYIKSSPGMLEGLGFEDANIILKFTNTAVMANFPFTMGSSFSDVAAGTCTAIVLANAQGTVNGTFAMAGSGTGTLVIPGGAMFTNVLQTMSTTSINIFCPSTFIGPFTLNTEGVVYDYYHSSSKFPILSVEYNQTTGNFPGAEKIVRLNTSVITGLNDLNFDATFNIFPNPAKDHFNVKLSNATNQNVTIEVINSLGAIAQTIDLGRDTEIAKNVSISNLAAGVYLIKTTLGDKVSVRKLIVE